MKRISYEIRVGEALRAKKMKLVLAESCTGGLIGHRITNIPGSSDYYLGSVTAYAYEAKEKLLGVQHATLEKFGAVSEETVLEMARGIRNTLSADIGVSVSGIAGPGGGLPHKPVGTVWFGISTPSGDWAFRFLFTGDRSQIKELSAEKALILLSHYLTEGHP